MKLRSVGVLAVAGVLALSACQAGTNPAASGGGGNKGTIKIGVDFPQSGGEAANGEPTTNGVKLAVKQANDKGGVNGWKIDLNVQDDAVNGVHDPQQGAKNAQTLVADTAVVAMVGPFNSNVARAQIPITNEAGLLQCSPANTNFGLTIPQYGAKDLRPKNPDKIAYVRVATTDLSQGAAGASKAYELGKNVYIVDDTETFGKGVADVFEQEFKKLGGTVIKRDGAPKSTTDYTPLLTAVNPKPDVVYFGGTTPTGAGLFRKQMVAAGMGNIPYVGPDGIVDGPGGQQGSFITVAGKDAANNSYGTVAAIHDIPNPTAFSDAYKKEFNKDPGAYSAPAYACTQAILTALEKAGGSTTDVKQLREAVRSYVTTPSNNFDTVLGTLHFDENGDTSQKIISFYKVDPNAAGGKGDWAFEKQQDFASSGGGASSPGASAGAGGGASPSAATSSASP